MIAQLSGSVKHQDKDFIILDVNHIGYKVSSTTENILSWSLNTQIDIWTYLVVRENSLDLYGFTSQEEKKFFELLIAISGIGPKSALGILNTASISTIKKAISSEDTSYLTKVSGIGKKSAGKIILELKNKIDKIGESSQDTKKETDIIEALQSMGYSPKEAVSALQKIDPKITETAKRLKEALKQLK
jgi:Holliday junction DNA helicase RuvA